MRPRWERGSGPQTLKVTRRLVMTETELLPTQNVSVFAAAWVPRYVFGWGSVAAVGLFGLFLTQWQGVVVTLLGLGFLGLGGWLAFLLATKGKRYGLTIVMNSGARRFYPTEDRQGLDAAMKHVARLFAEVQRESAAAVISINANQVSFKETTVNGVLAAGDVEGGIHVDQTHESPGPA